MRQTLFAACLAIALPTWAVHPEILAQEEALRDLGVPFQRVTATKETGGAWMRFTAGPGDLLTPEVKSGDNSFRVKEAGTYEFIYSATRGGKPFAWSSVGAVYYSAHPSGHRRQDRALPTWFVTMTLYDEAPVTSVKRPLTQPFGRLSEMLQLAGFSFDAAYSYNQGASPENHGSYLGRDVADKPDIIEVLVFPQVGDLLGKSVRTLKATVATLEQQVARLTQDNSASKGRLSLLETQVAALMASHQAAASSASTSRQYTPVPSLAPSSLGSGRTTPTPDDDDS